MTIETNARIEIREKARELSERHRGYDAPEIIRTAARQIFPGQIGLVSSFGTEAVVLLHMVSRIDPFIPVIFLETRKHFPETLAYRERLAENLGLCNLQIVSPRPASL